MQITVLPAGPVTPQEALNALVATGFRVYFVNEAMLASAPLFEVTEVDYVFDPLGKLEDLIPRNKVDNVFEVKYGCKPIHNFVGVCAALALDPGLVDAGPIAIQWLDGSRRTCCAAWGYWNGCRRILVAHSDVYWDGAVRFPRARK